MGDVMRYEKEKCERLILESTLFSLNKEEQYSAYKRELYRMIENLYCYLMSINESAYEPYACEITEVATRCINNFDENKGEFLHYFNKSWKQEYSHILGRENQEEKYRGLKISEEDKRIVKRYKRLLQQHGEEYSQKELYDHLSEAMDIPVDEIKRIDQLNSTSVIGATSTCDDGEEINLWDYMTDDFLIETEFITEDKVRNILEKIEDVYINLQKRQQAIISDLLTIKLFEIIDTENLNYSFLNHELVNEVVTSKIVRTQRDIAAKYNRDEASISRTYKEFVKKVKREG